MKLGIGTFRLAWLPVGEEFALVMQEASGVTMFEFRLSREEAQALVEELDRYLVQPVLLVPNISFHFPPGGETLA